MEQHARTGLHPDVAALIDAKGEYYAEKRNLSLKVYQLLLSMQTDIFDGNESVARAMRRSRNYVWLERRVVFLDGSPAAKADRLANALIFPEIYLDLMELNPMELAIQLLERVGIPYNPSPTDFKS